MGDLTKIEYWVLTVTVGVQVILMFMVGDAVAALVPGVLVAPLMINLSFRSPRNYQVLAQRPLRPWIGAIIFGIAAWSWFVWGSDDMSFRLRLARVLLVDVALFSFVAAAMVTVRFNSKS